MNNDTAATIAARRADLREMLFHGDDHFEGIDKDDALSELLDLLDQQDAEPIEALDHEHVQGIVGRKVCHLCDDLYD